MTSRKKDLSGVYPQRKKSGVSKPGRSAKSSSFEATFENVSLGAGSLGSSSAQPSALPSCTDTPHEDPYDDVEEILRQFDMDMVYGPCLGVSRLERWNRANTLGLNPPPNIKTLLERSGAVPYCLWEGRV